MKENDIRPEAIFREYLELCEKDAKIFFKNTQLEQLNCPACETKGELVFEKNGFKIQKISSGLSGTAWKVYDVQTRPILHFLVRLFNFFPSILRIAFKLIWMIILYPVILLFFLFYSNIYFNNNKNCYHVFEIRKK